jgi:hypothetical protein
MLRFEWMRGLPQAVNLSFGSARDFAVLSGRRHLLAAIRRCP